MARAVEAGRERLPVPRVIQQVLVQRLPDALYHRTADLIFRRLLIDDAARLVHRHVFRDPHMAQDDVHLDLDEVRAEAVAHLASVGQGFSLASQA